MYRILINVMILLLMLLLWWAVRLDGKKSLDLEWEREINWLFTFGNAILIWWQICVGETLTNCQCAFAIDWNTIWSISFTFVVTVGVSPCGKNNLGLNYFRCCIIYTWYYLMWKYIWEKKGVEKNTNSYKTFYPSI